MTSPEKKSAALRDETNALTLRRDHNPARCPAQVNRGDYRWSEFVQCSRPPKEEIERRDGTRITVCGFHVGVVKKANERNAKYEAERQRSRNGEQQGTVAAEALRALGFDASPAYRLSIGGGSLGRYTGGVELTAEATEALIRRLREAIKAEVESALQEQETR